MSSEIQACLLKFSDDQLDSSMKPLIEKWDNPVTSIQLLEVIDKCIYSSLSSGTILSVLQIMYEQALKEEGKTHEQNVPLAIWRNC